MNKRLILAALLFAAPQLQACDCECKDKYTLKVGAFEKTYDMLAPAKDATVKIAYVYDYADNLNLIQEAAKTIYTAFKTQGILKTVDAVVVPGDKANAIGAMLAHLIQQDNPKMALVIFRGSNKAGDFKKITYQSITSTHPKEMHMREDQAATLKGKNVVILDDVLSTGETMKAATSLVTQAGGNVIAYACVATEGQSDASNGGKIPETFAGRPLIKITHLPVVANK